MVEQNLSETEVITPDELKDIVNDDNVIEKPLETLDKLSRIVPGLYPNWRPNQYEVIKQIHKSNKKFVALQAPTGYGKSVTAVGTVEVEGDRGIILTQTKQLGEQYYSDFRQIGLKTVKGRSNFQCALPSLEDKTADQAPCVAGMKCVYKSGGCDYYDQKREAADSNLTSMNIHYFLYEANFGGDFSGINTLFIDEAHKLESVLMEFIKIRFNKERFRDEGQEIPKKISIPILSDWVDSALPTFEAELAEILEELESNPSNEIATIRAIRLAGAKSNLEKFKLVDDTWIIEEDDYSIVLKPIWVSKYIEDILFKHAKRIILMSATLPRSILEGLGILDYEYINLPSTFEAKNRPCIWLPSANLARSASDPQLELRKLTAAIDAIADKFINEKGMIHTVNYRITEHVLKNSRHADRIITHENAGDRELVLQRFKDSKTNSILMSPSFTEGVDLPYDQCRWQIICKIPYTDMSDKQVQARMKVDPEWYATSAIVTMIQAYGRIMRSEDDSGVTYILDSSLMNLISRWRTIFDQVSWFLDALFISTGKKLIPFNEYIELEKIKEEEK